METTVNVDEKIQQLETVNKILANELASVKSKYKKLEQFILKNHSKNQDTKIEDIVVLEERKGLKFKNDIPGPAGQKYFCFSYISSDKISNLDTDLIIVRSMPDGNVFETEEDANKALEYYHAQEPNIDVSVGQFGQWIAFKKLNDVKNQKFDDPKKTEFFEATKTNNSGDMARKKALLDRQSEDLKNQYTKDRTKDADFEKYRKDELKYISEIKPTTEKEETLMKLAENLKKHAATLE